MMRLQASIAQRVSQLTEITLSQLYEQQILIDLRTGIVSFIPYYEKKKVQINV